MSDKRSQSDARRPPAKPGGGKSKAKPAKPEAAAAEAAADKPKSTADKPKSTADKPKGTQAMKLPAYGLAADVLAASGSGSGAEPTGAFDVRVGDPERIFSFADRLAAHSEADAAPAAATRITTWVTFSLAGEIFALPVEPVREVLRVTSITRVPHAPAPIRGVSNVRGRVIPVIDLRLRIGLPAADLDRSSRVVVVRSRGRLLGLLVDAVHQVAHLDLNQAQPPPEDVMTLQSDYISGVYHLEEQLVLLLDVERALLIRDDAGGAAAGDGLTPDGRSADRGSRQSAPGAA